MIGQWLHRMHTARRARKVWNKGVPLMTMETAQYVSEHYASYWAAWASELVMEHRLQYTPKCIPIAAVVNREFWCAAMAHHGRKDKNPNYWHPLLGMACVEGNLSIVEAFAQTFGLGCAAPILEKFSHLHPRVVNWQANHGVATQKHVLDLVRLPWKRDDMQYCDAQAFTKGGKTMLAWVEAWVQLPDTLIGPRDGYAVLAFIAPFLNEMPALGGPRTNDGMPTLARGYEDTKHRPYPEVSSMKPPLLARDALAMQVAVYKRFGFEPVLMDALLGRWTQHDLHDPRVCVIAGSNHAHNENHWDADNAQRAQRMGQSEALMLHALEWADKDGFSQYNAALVFFRRQEAQLETAESFDMAGLLD